MPLRRSVEVLALVAFAALAAVLVVASLRPGRRSGGAPGRHDAGGAIEALDVEVSGCTEITRLPACAVSEDTELRLWIPRALVARVAISVDGHALQAASAPSSDGVSFRVVIPRGSADLAVREERDAGAAEWSVRLVPAWTESATVKRARELRSAGRLGEAAAILEGAASDDAGRAEGVALLGLVEYARGHIDAAVARLREAIALHDAEGRSSAAGEDGLALAFLLLERGRFGEVRPLLADVAERARAWPEGSALVTYYEGLLAWDTGDLRSALRWTREAEHHAAQLGSVRLRRMAAQSIARQLLDLGRDDEALAALRALLASDGEQMNACDRADLLDNVAWAALLRAGSGAPSDHDLDLDPRDPLARALAIFRDACPDPNRVANSLENVALAELERGRLAEASAALAGAKEAAHDPGIPVVLFWLHLDGRVALASGRAEPALRSFAREADVAAALGTNDDQRLAGEDRALALIALGRKDAALDVVEAADALVDAGGAFVPLGEGKETFFRARDRTGILRVKLLVELHRERDAMLAARRIRTRLLEGLKVSAALGHLDPDARGRWQDLIGGYRSARQGIDADAAHDWELSSDRLAAALDRRRESAAKARALLDDALSVLPIPRARDASSGAPRALAKGELELLYLPADAGWLGFARDDAGVRAQPLGSIDMTASPEDLARGLLHPFDAEIARANRVRLLLYGAVRGVDVHALPWHGRPLLEHAAVEYALDAGDTAGDSRLAPAASPRRALLVADPTGDLPAARAEADGVASAFSAAHGWTIQSLRGTDARAEPLRSALGGAALFHYAGHAMFGGPDGLDSALPLAGGGKLTPGDVLALPSVPRLVSLFGCETGRESANGVLDSLGLANAFLVAGARGVVGTSRVVDDELARGVAAKYYARLLVDPALDPAAALRAALLATRDGSPASDWQAFRVLVP